jgi:hypothetical protein
MPAVHSTILKLGVAFAHKKIGFRVKPDPTQKTHRPISVMLFEIFL